MLDAHRHEIEPNEGNPLTMKAFDQQAGDGKAVEMAAVDVDGDPFGFRVEVL